MSIRDFDLTDFRRNSGHVAPVDIADKLTGSLEILPHKYHFLATINQSKIIINGREKIYRLMLFDLSAISETTLPEDVILEGFDLVVATRTINGVRQSNASDIPEAVFNLIPQSLEVDSVRPAQLLNICADKIVSTSGAVGSRRELRPYKASLRLYEPSR